MVTNHENNQITRFIVYISDLQIKHRAVLFQTSKMYLNKSALSTDFTCKFI